MSTWFPALTAKQWLGFAVAVVVVMLIVERTPLRRVVR